MYNKYIKNVLQLVFKCVSCDWAVLLLGILYERIRGQCTKIETVTVILLTTVESANSLLLSTDYCLIRYATSIKCNHFHLYMLI